MKHVYLLALACLVSFSASAQKPIAKPKPAHEPKGPRVLVVTAHPDDESGSSATIYKITHEQDGVVDLFCITNGEAGYKYSTLAEPIYGLELTDEKVGRKHLPAIREKELRAACNIIGIRNIYFQHQKDAHYGLNEHEPLDTSWNVPLVSANLDKTLKEGRYDFVFCLLPEPRTHGGHKAATLLALRAVAKIPATQRPVVLSGGFAIKGDTTRTHFTKLKDYSETAVIGDTALFRVDRTTPFGFKGALNYQTIVNWEISEHKSQGTMQAFANKIDFETFFYYQLNPPDGLERTRALFEKLKTAPYKAKTY